MLCRKALDDEQQRVAYYPNSDTKFQRFKKAFQGVEEHGAQPMQTNGFKTAPWLLKTGLTPQEVGNNNNSHAFQLIVLARYVLVRPLQEVGCGKIEMHSLARDEALQSASLAYVWQTGRMCSCLL